MRSGHWVMWLVVAGMACDGETDSDLDADTGADTAAETDSDADTDNEADTDSEAEADLVDADGNTYATVQIGEQVWMAENLKVTSFNDGTPIGLWSFGEDWYYALEPMAWYQWSSTYDLNNIYPDPLPEDFYGALYNEFALDSGRLAPDGWRLPTRADFEVLEQTLTADGLDATALKTDFGWSPETSNGTDDYGFNALPSGYVSAGGTATGTPAIVILATSETNPAARTRHVVTLFDDPTLQYNENGVQLGAGVRLIRE